MLDTPNTLNHQTYHALWAGFSAATDRFNDARAAGVRSPSFWDPMITFQSTFEILNWASALDEYVAKNWTIDGEHVGWTWRGRVDDGDLVNAIRFARNRVHHQWATALVPSMTRRIC